MKIVTWNVNSLRARLERVLDWMAANEPDVLLMQETKCADAVFPSARFLALGYETAHHGNNQWNGVAIASRVGLEDERAGFFDDEPDAITESRILSAYCGRIRCYSVYVPNGRMVDSDHYVAKLAWLGRLRVELEKTCTKEDPVVVCGDFNVAPEDRDVWDISQFVGATHVSAPERAALSAVLDWGLTDAFRALNDDELGPFSWWDYRAGAFHKGWGMRIDHVLVSEPVRRRLRSAYIDRDARKGKQPSDHAPVVVEIED